MQEAISNVRNAHVTILYGVEDTTKIHLSYFTFKFFNPSVFIFKHDVLGMN
jgi:hypothetical protein